MVCSAFSHVPHEQCFCKDMKAHIGPAVKQISVSFFIKMYCFGISETQKLATCMIQIFISV